MNNSSIRIKHTFERRGPDWPRSCANSWDRVIGLPASYRRSTVVFPGNDCMRVKARRDTLARCNYMCIIWALTVNPSQNRHSRRSLSSLHVLRPSSIFGLSLRPIQATGGLFFFLVYPLWPTFTLRRAGNWGIAFSATLTYRVVPAWRSQR